MADTATDDLFVQQTDRLLALKNQIAVRHSASDVKPAVAKAVFAS
jgi:hypothetical protein